MAGDHGWERGVDQGYLAQLISYWVDTYDWREYERRIGADVLPVG